MYRIYSTLIEMVAAAVFIIPIWCIYNKLYFRSWKITFLYMIFGFYLTAVLALVGFPNIISLKVELTVNIIPFVYMINDFINACLNVFIILFPLAFFLPVLWKEFRNAKKIIYSRICNDIIYRNSSNFHRTNDRYRWHYYKHCRDFNRISYCILVYRCLTRRIVKNSKRTTFT